MLPKGTHPKTGCVPFALLLGCLARPPGLRRHRRNHGVVTLAFSRDAVVVLRGEERQQPLFGHLIGVLVRERL